MWGCCTRMRTATKGRTLQRIKNTFSEVIGKNLFHPFHPNFNSLIIKQIHNWLQHNTFHPHPTHRIIGFKAYSSSYQAFLSKNDICNLHPHQHFFTRHWLSMHLSRHSQAGCKTHAFGLQKRSVYKLKQALSESKMGVFAKRFLAYLSTHYVSTG